MARKPPEVRDWVTKAQVDKLADEVRRLGNMVNDLDWWRRQYDHAQVKVEIDKANRKEQRSRRAKACAFAALMVFAACVVGYAIAKIAVFFAGGA